MKDLKHLFYFEKLLDDANNELVREAQSNGRLALGYTCYHMPEVLLNLGRCFSIRLRAPRTGSRKAMRTSFNQYMQNIFHAEPLDPSLLDYEDALTW